MLLRKPVNALISINVVYVVNLFLFPIQYKPTTKLNVWEQELWQLTILWLGKAQLGSSHRASMQLWSDAHCAGGIWRLGWHGRLRWLRHPHESLETSQSYAWDLVIFVPVACKPFWRTCIYCIMILSQNSLRNGSYITVFLHLVTVKTFHLSTCVLLFLIF